MKIISKLKYIILIWYSIVLHQTVYAQQEFSVKEYHTLFSSYKTDTQNINRLLQKADELQFIPLDTTFYLYQQAFSQSININYEEGIIIAAFGLSDCYEMRGLLDSSIIINQQAYAYCLKALPAKGRLVRLYNNLAQANFFKGEFSTAAYFNYKALQELYRSNVSSPYLATLTYLLAARPLHLFGEHEKSLVFLKRAEYVACRYKKIRLLSHIYSDMASIYFEFKDWQKSEEYAMKVFNLDKKYCDPTAYITAATTLTYVYTDGWANPDKALFYAQTAFNCSERIKQSGAKINACHALGYAYCLAKKYDKAEYYLLLALDETERSGTRENMRNVHGTLADVYKAMGKYKKALYHQEIYGRAKDSLWSKENTELLHKISVKYDLAQKNIALTEKQLQITDQKNVIKDMYIWMIAIIAGCLLIIVISIALYKNNKHRQNLQNERIQNLQHQQDILEQEQEISQLKAMMKGEEKERERMARELHDGAIGQLSIIKMIFNALQNRYNILTTASDYIDAVQQLDDTTLELRKIAHNMMPEVLIKEGLYCAIQNFCKKISHATTVNFNVSLSGSIPLLDTDIELAIYRTIQELTQNIVKHAHATKALVHFTYHDTILSITIEDNGIGLGEQMMQAYSGMGLRNIKSRINMLFGTFDINSSKEGTSIYIEFNITKLKKQIPVCA